MKTLDLIAFIILLIGGLNWGLVGIFEWNLVAAIFGTMSVLSRIIYILVVISAIYLLISWKPMHRRWVAQPAQAQ